MSLLLLTVSGMVLIVLAADYFTNGVEWLGYHLHLEEGAVGSLLAALGTALPETLVPVMAIIFGQGHSENAIGLGAILGAPFMLATIGFSVIGVGLWASRRKSRTLNVPTAGPMTDDLGFFFWLLQWWSWRRFFHELSIPLLLWVYWLFMDAMRGSWWKVTIRLTNAMWHRPSLLDYRPDPDRRWCW